MGMTIENLDDLRAYLSGIRDDLNNTLERLEMIEDVIEDAMERIEDGSDN